MTHAEYKSILIRTFLVIYIAVTSVFFIVEYFVYSKFGVELTEGDLVNFTPFAISIIVVLIFFRPQVNLFRFEKGADSWMFQGFAVMAISIPLFMMSEYLSVATGKLTILNDIHQFSWSKRTKYYALNIYYIDKNHFEKSSVTSESGKQNELQNIDIFYAIPILESITDTINARPSCWIGHKYEASFHKSIPLEDREQRVKEFISNSHKEFSRTDFSDFYYLELINNTRDYWDYESLLSGNQDVASVHFVFKAHRGSFESRCGDRLFHFVGLWVISGLAFVVFLFVYKPSEVVIKEKKKRRKKLKDSDE